MKMLKLISKVLLCVLLISGSSAFAASKNNQQLTDDLTKLQQGVNQLQEDMQGYRKLLDNRAMLELFQRMDELSEEASQLRGMLEQQDHDLAGIKKRQRELYLDIDRRMRELEMTSNRSSGAAPPVTPVVPAEPLADTPSIPALPVIAAPVIQKPTADNAEPAAPAVSRPATIQGGSSRNDTPVSDERVAYQKAFDMLKEGRYKMANTAFKDFIDQYPESSYAGNSQYWLGESNYVTRQFEQAVTEFNAVLNKYPSSNKVPDAMLKLGYTYYELGRFTEARQILEQLKKREPSSTAARLAGKRLERMSHENR